MVLDKVSRIRPEHVYDGLHVMTSKIQWIVPGVFN